MISWFRQGQQKQLSNLEGRERDDIFREEVYFSGKSLTEKFWREFQTSYPSPEGPVGLDDHLVVAVGDGHLEGALLVAALELFGFS